jgi:hypothetical protein
MLNEPPTLYVTNWSSHRTPGMFGTGKRWSIMAAPRAWEIGDGVINCLTPDLADLRAVQAGTIDVDTYRARYEAKVLRHHMASSMLVPSYLHPGWRPGALPPKWGAVGDGDTLCCACSRADAAAGRCHRCWLAPMLVRAGWRVVLDGSELTSDAAEVAFDEQWERFTTEGRTAALKPIPAVRGDLS